MFGWLAVCLCNGCCFVCWSMFVVVSFCNFVWCAYRVKIIVCAMLNIIECVVLFVFAIVFSRAVIFVCADVCVFI